MDIITGAVADLGPVQATMRAPKSFLQRHEVVQFYGVNAQRAQLVALASCWPDDVASPWGPLAQHDFNLGKWAEHIADSLSRLEGVSWPKVLASSLVALTICAQGQINAMEVEAQAGFTGAVGDNSIAS